MQFHEKYTLTVPVGEQDHIQGSDSAKVTLVEYGDYQCPYCGEAYPIVKQLQKDFGDQLRFVFRNFPLTEIHPYSFHAAEGAEIADDYGKFWEMHDAIYEHQKTLDDASLTALAEGVGIDGSEFASKLASNSKQQKVKDDFMSGVDSGVNGTPSFYINGVKYAGSWDYDSLKQVLQSMM